MDRATSTPKEQLQRLLREAAEVPVALDQAEGTAVGVPHYAAIEARAHELGCQPSREIQARHMGVLTAAATAAAAACPECGTRCEALTRRRRVTSVDGPLTVAEPVAHCPACRRDFFPPTDPSQT